jgi:putative transposase
MLTFLTAQQMIDEAKKVADTVDASAYYDWLKRPGKLISAETLLLFRKMKELFELSRNSLGSREMMKK